MQAFRTDRLVQKSRARSKRPVAKAAYFVRGSFVWILVGFSFVAGVRSAEAQTAAIQKEVEKKVEKAASLEEMIQQALKNNPDIRIAEVKLREAQAERDRTRLHVASDVGALLADISAAKAAHQEGMDRVLRAQKLVARNAMAQEDYKACVLTLDKLTAELAAKKAKLPYLVGKVTIEEKKTDDKGPTADQLRADALKHNPDILYSEVKMQAAEADLNRVRMKVAMEVAAVDTEVRAARKHLDDAEQRARELQRAYQEGSLPKASLTQALAELEKAKAELPIKQAKLPYLLGQQPAASGTSRAMDEMYGSYLLALQTRFANGPVSPLTEKLRKSLDAPVSFTRMNVAPVELMKALRDEILGGDVNLTVRVKAWKTDAVDVILPSKVPAGAMLQFLEDELEVVFVLRDYGIVVVAADEKLPPGAMRVIDFWKQGKALETTKDQSKEKK